MLGVVGVILYLVMAESGYPVFYLVCAYAAVYALTFVIGYGLMRNLNILLRLGRFAVYIVAAVEGNIIIILLLPRLYLVSCLLFTLVVFILLAFLNFTISKVIFAASNREACLIGMLTGFVGALLSMMVGPAFFI